MTLGPQFRQTELFNAGSYTESDPRPPSFDEWLSRDNISYHGTFRHDWEDAPSAHFGSLDQANTRLKSIGKSFIKYPSSRYSYYKSQSDDYDYEPFDEFEHHEARIYARDLDVAKNTGRLTDTDANAADALYRLYDGESMQDLPTSIRESMDDKGPSEDFLGNIDTSRMRSYATDGTGLMLQGYAIPYRNDVETNDWREDDTSYVAPLGSRGAAKSWEQEVVDHPRSSDLAKRYAQERIDNQMASTVPVTGKKWKQEQTVLFDEYMTAKGKSYAYPLDSPQYEQRKSVSKTTPTSFQRPAWSRFTTRLGQAGTV